MTVTCSPLTSDPPFSLASARIALEVFEYDYIRSLPSTASSPYISSDDDSNGEDEEDEDEHNHRIAPHWQAYRHLFESHGYHLDTCKDVRQFYLHYWETRNIQRSIQSCAGYQSACRENRDDNELCRDEGLPEHLFRGKRLLDDLPIVIKAAHRQSREIKVITALSTPPLRNDPMNHCIPVLDIIHAPLDVPRACSHAVYRDEVSFIIMEEWSPRFIPPEQPHTLQSYLSSLRNCIQHIAFMHAHCFAHLDISVHNVLTNYHGRYAYIDYEMSRQFCQPPVEVEEGGDPRSSVLIYQKRAAEIPPEVERGHSTSPYAMDVWALGMLISKAGISTGYDVPELRSVTEDMLEPRWETRPSAKTVLRRFEEAVSSMSEGRSCSVPSTLYAIPVVPS